jgi:chaperonin GroES
MATALKIEPLNTSGLDPLDNRVLVRKDPAEEKVGSIILPDSERDKKKFAMTRATVIAVGALAWAEAKHDSKQFGLGFVAPIPGDRVQIGKYTGDNITGADGQEYTIINDTDVIGRLIGE